MITIDGIKEIEETLDKIHNINSVKEKMQKCCAVVEASAKQMAPKDTGTLQNSIASEVEVDGTEVQGVVFTPLEYAPYVEFGTGLFAEGNGRKDVPWNYQDEKGNWHSTSGQKPQPFLRPALMSNRNKIIEIIKEGLLDD